MEDTLEFLFDAFPGLAILVNSKGEIKAFNQNVIKKISLNFDKLLESKVADIRILSDISVTKTLKTKEPTYGYQEYNDLGKNKSLIYCNLPTTLEDGNCGVLSLIMILPTVINNFDQLATLFAQDDKIDKCSNLGVGLLNSTGIITYLSQNSLKNLGFEIGQPLEEAAKNFQGDNYKSVTLQAIDTDRLMQARKFVKTENSSRAIHALAFPFKLEDKVVGGIWFDIDISKMIDYTRQIRQAKRIENIGEMAFRVIHEIRNPLQEIIASSQVGALKSANKEIVNYFKEINAKVEQVKEILNETLQLSKPEQINLEKVKLHSILNKINKSMYQKCQEKDIDLKVEKNKKDLTFIVDENLFVQAILNIIENAIYVLQDYPGHKKIVIKSWVNGGEIFFSIYNTGPEITQSIKTSIFDAFTSTKGKNGTGLGLAITHYIITKIHQGGIWFESDGAGTTFYLKIKKSIDRVANNSEMSNYKAINL